MPANLKFEIDDATQEWTWPDNALDFVHLRYLVGAITDWPALLRQAYRCCRPGGWVETCEMDGNIISDDGTAEAEVGFQTWNRVFSESGPKMGRSFNTVADNLQRPAVEAAGFEDIHVVNYKVPVGGWPRDKALAEIGRCVQHVFMNDMHGESCLGWLPPLFPPPLTRPPGYTLLLWNNVLQWDSKEHQVFLTTLRGALANKSAHPYMNVRYVYARKPEEAGKSS